MEENKKTISLDNNNFKVFSNGLEFSIRFNLNDDFIDLFVCREDSMENFNQFFSFLDINSTQCFKFEEDLAEILTAMKNYIVEEKVTFEIIEEGLKICFETQFNKKKLKSELILPLVEEDIENTVKMMKIKMNFLIQENKKKDLLLEKLNEDRILYSHKISSLDGEVIKMKDILEKQANQIKNYSDSLKENSYPEFDKSNSNVKLFLAFFLFFFKIQFPPLMKQILFQRFYPQIILILI